MVHKDGARTILAGGDSAPEDKLVLTDQWPFTGESADYWLEVPESAWPGDLASARSYVSIRRVKPGFLDISHWFWYPANGCGTARVRTLAFDTTIMTQERVALTTLGFHVSDWEKVTIRITDDAENRVDSVYFAQHAGGHWLRPDQLQYEQSGNFAVYASRNGHASYPVPGEHYTAHIKTAPPGIWAKLTPAALEIWLRNDAMKGARKVDCSVNHEIVSIQEGADGIILTDDGSGPAAGVPFFGRIEPLSGGQARLREPKWLNYPYRWGPETEQKISHQVVFEALKMAIGPLAVYGAMTFGAMLPILGVIAGLLVPTFVKMENENGKPGPKTKYFTDPGQEIDRDSGEEPDNLFHEAVGGGIASMVAWVEGAAGDVADWTVARAEEVADWTKGAAGSVENWTLGAANDVAGWTTGAANDTASWFTGAAGSVEDWTVNAAGDAGKWIENAANSAGDWVTDTAEDAARTLDPRNW